MAASLVKRIAKKHHPARRAQRDCRTAYDEKYRNSGAVTMSKCRRPWGVQVSGAVVPIVHAPDCTARLRKAGGGIFGVGMGIGIAVES